MSKTLEEGLQSYRIGPKVKALRTSKKLGLKELGNHTGLSAGMLSKIEREQLVPTLPTLLRIAMVFGVGLEHFFSDGDQVPLQEVVRPDDRVRLPVMSEGRVSYYFESLDYKVFGRSTEAFLAIFPRGGPNSQPHAHDGIELVHVLEGEVSVEMRGRVTHLKKGETLSFDGGYEHSYRGRGQALVFVRPNL